MKNLTNCVLFHQVNENDITSLLKCLNSRIKKYDKNQTIIFEQDSLDYIGVVLSGELHLTKLDFDGNQNIISVLQGGDIFGESVVYSKDKFSPFTIITAKDSEILRLDFSKLCQTCTNACIFHTQVIYNLLKAISDKNILLTQKLDVLTKRSIKEKVLTYLSAYSKKVKSKSFTIPLNRQQLADYLSIERSSLSYELCKLRDEGIIDFNKSFFTLNI